MIFSGEKGLDFAIAEARRHGIKIILSFANNYESFGGKKAYVDWARSRGRPVSSEDDFFTDSLVKDFYKNHIKVSNQTLIFLSCVDFNQTKKLYGFLTILLISLVGCAEQSQYLHQSSLQR